MEKRLRFIRSPNPFAGLDDYLIADEFRIKNNQIEYPIQLALDGFRIIPAEEGMKGKLGYYFESLSQGIYGGRLRGFPQPVNGSRHSREVVTLEPDIVDDEKNYLRDSKAVSPGNCVKIEDVQLGKYVCLQLKKNIPNPSRITFEIFRHGVRGLVKNFKHKPLEELVNMLSTNTRFMISLPLSVLLAVHNFGLINRYDNNKPKYSYRYDGEKYRHYSSLSSHGLNAILAYPEETLVRYGLSPDNYNILKLRLPKGITMNRREIRPFPVLLIRDKNHGEWLEQFRARGRELHPEIFEVISNQLEEEI